MLGRYTTGPRGQRGYHRVCPGPVVGPTFDATRDPYTSQHFAHIGVSVIEPESPLVTDTGGATGAAGDSAAPQADVRTFLIADIRGYTTYTRENGDEAAAALVNRFAEIVAEIAAARDGYLLEMRGDEALVAFVSARKALRA